MTKKIQACFVDQNNGFTILCEHGAGGGLASIVDRQIPVCFYIVFVSAVDKRLRRLYRDLMFLPKNNVMVYKHIMGSDRWLKQTDNWEGG